jgi:hypothetical protein
MTTAEVMTEVSRIAREEAPSNLPALIAKLAEAQAIALSRLLTPAPSAEEPRQEDRLLTMPQVAEILGVAEDYARTLARLRKIPTVRLPGLDRGGRACEGKYIRVLLSSLRAWMKEREEKDLDYTYRMAYLSGSDRHRGQGNPKAPQAHPGSTRGAARGRPKLGGKVGAGGVGNPADGGEAHAAPAEHEANEG